MKVKQQQTFILTKIGIIGNFILKGKQFGLFVIILSFIFHLAFCGTTYTRGNNQPPQFTCFGLSENDPSVCSRNGKCVGTNDCSCLPGATGVDCSNVTCFGVPQNSSTVCSGLGICSGPNFCGCYSGFYGDNCQFNASTTTCFFNTLSMDSILYPPSLNTSGTFFTNDTLFIQIDSPLITGRLNTMITIQNSLRRNCEYPGPYWNLTIDPDYPCGSSYTLAIPWKIGQFCSWDISVNNTNQLVFSGNIVITQIDDLTTFLLPPTPIRTITSIIPIEIVFQQRISMTASIFVTNNNNNNNNNNNHQQQQQPPYSQQNQNSLMTSKFLSFFRKYIQPSMVKLISSNKAEESALSSSSSSGGYDNYVTAVLTDQEYYIGPPQRGYFEFFTKTQFPFRLFNPQIITLPPGLNPTPIQEVPLPGQCQQNQECIQKWRFFTDITTACTLTGSYQVSFNQNCFNWGNKVCQNNQQFAPSVSITVNSENFCTVVQLNIQLAVNITSIPGIPLLPIIPLLQHEMSSADSKSIIIQPQRLTEHSRSLLEINGIPEYPSNQPMYFKATAESSETYISTMSFHRMQVTGSKNSYLLYENGVPTSHGKRMGLQFFKVNTGGGPLEKNSMTKFFKFTPSQAELGSPITLSSVFHVGYGFMNGWKGWSQSNSNLPFSSSSYSFNSQRSAAATRANTAALSPADWQHSSLWMYQNDEAQRTVAQGPNDAGVSEARATLEFALSMQISVGSPLFLLQNLLSTLLAAISIFSIFFFTDIPINVI